MTSTSINEQFEKTIFNPFRTYAELAVEHFEKVTQLQYDAAKAYTDLGIQQARAALEIKDQQGIQQYVESQQKAAQSLGERVKGDAEKVVAMQQEFAQKAQKAAESSVNTATKAATQSK